jgi:hypothetical protein
MNTKLYSQQISHEKNKKIGVKRMNRVPVKAMKSGFSD